MKLWIKEIVECEQTDLLKGNEPVIKVNLTIWTEDNRIEHKTELWTEKEYVENVDRGYYERVERKENMQAVGGRMKYLIGAAVLVFVIWIWKTK